MVHHVGRVCDPLTTVVQRCKYIAPPVDDRVATDIQPSVFRNMTCLAPPVDDRVVTDIQPSVFRNMTCLAPPVSE